MDFSFLQPLTKPAESTIVLLVMDGLGDLPGPGGDATALEAASTPNFDALLKDSICGLQEPVGPGITPGSGPGHLGVFGYNPMKYTVGRGVLSALGIDFDLQPNDVAARGNFCTLDDSGRVTDRRAGRISTELNEELCAVLREIEVPGVEVFVETVKEHRLLLVLRGEGLSGDIDDTDPQEVGKAPLDPEPRSEDAAYTAKLVRQFLAEARKKLADRHPANMVLLRGFANQPDWPTYEDVFGLRAASIAAYPMYRGVSKLVGMDALKAKDDPAAQIQMMKEHWDDYDFFYMHVKRIDSAGEDGDFDRKVELIENVDQHLPDLLDLGPDVFFVTGDHSTPCAMKYHSWHPVPVLLWSEVCRPDPVGRDGETFGEAACLGGGLGRRMPAVDLMPLALAHADRLEKFGA